jgi:4-diphosphocytidyl-2-C-methyl-D-erythritol kinase
VSHLAAAVRVDAPAKVNLALEVLGRRPDGYHELATLFHALDLADHLTLLPVDGLALTVAGDAPASEDNLVLRAARALRERAPDRSARIHLEKRIPAGAGLGGGSSDAAATLLALRDLWGLEIPLAELEEIGRGLGADVPFFLHRAAAALGRSRGDEIAPLERVPPLWLALSTPPFSLPNKTARIFAELRPDEHTDGARTQQLAAALARGSVPETGDLFNALAPPASRAFADLDAYAAALRRASGRAWALTGAGPALFTLCGSPEEAEAIRAAVSEIPGRHLAAAGLQRPS